MDAKTRAVIAAELPPEDAERVLAALEKVVTDPGVGTVLRNPATGDVATYVRQYAETYWRVVSLDDRSWVEMEPLIGWDTLHEGVTAVTTPATVDPVADEATAASAPAKK